MSAGRRCPRCAATSLGTFVDLVDGDVDVTVELDAGDVVVCEGCGLVEIVVDVAGGALERRPLSNAELEALPGYARRAIGRRRRVP